MFLLVRKRAGSSAVPSPRRGTRSLQLLAHSPLAVANDARSVLAQATAAVMQLAPRPTSPARTSIWSDGAQAERGATSHVKLATRVESGSPSSPDTVFAEAFGGWWLPAGEARPVGVAGGAPSFSAPAASALTALQPNDEALVVRVAATLRSIIVASSTLGLPLAFRYLPPLLLAVHRVGGQGGEAGAVASQHAPSAAMRDVEWLVDSLVAQRFLCHERLDALPGGWKIGRDAYESIRGGVVGRWISLLGGAGRYADAKALVMRLTERGRPPEIEELRALMCAAVDCGQFGESAVLYMCAPDLGVPPDEVGQLKAVMVETAFEAARVGKAAQLIDLLKIADAGRAADGATLEELSARAARGQAGREAVPQRLTETKLRALVAAVLRSPGFDPGSEPGEPITAANAQAVAATVARDMESALGVACALAELDPAGRTFSWLWRLRVRVAALQVLLKGRPQALADALTGGELAVRRSFESNLRSLASAITGLPSVQLATGKSAAAPNWERLVPREEVVGTGVSPAEYEDMGKDGAIGSLKASAAAAMHAAMAGHVNGVAADLLRGVLRSTARAFGVEHVGPGSASAARTQLADRVHRILSTLSDLGVQADNRVLSAALHVAVETRSPSAVQGVLTAGVADMSAADQQAVVSDLAPLFRSPLHSSTLLQCLPSMVEAGVRPTPHMVADLLTSAGRTWATAQAVACPACGQGLQDAAHVVVAGGDVSHPLASRRLGPMPVGQTSVLHATVGARAFGTLAAQESGVGVLEVRAGLPGVGAAWGDGQGVPIVKGRVESRRGGGHVLPPTQYSSAGRHLLQALGLLQSLPTRTGGRAVELDKSVQCAGAARFNPRLEEEWPIYPSKALSIVSGLGLLEGAGPVGGVPAPIAAALVTLGRLVGTAGCGREAWAVWTVMRSLRQPEVYDSGSGVVRGLLRVFLAGHLQVPAWESFLVLFPRPGAGPLPSVRAMQLRLDKEDARVEEQQAGGGRNAGAQAARAVPVGVPSAGQQAALAIGLASAARVSASPTHHTTGAGGGATSRGDPRPPPAPLGRKVYIGNVRSTVSEEQLGAYLARFGKVLHCSIPYDAAEGRTKGYALVEFATEASAAAVVDGVHVLHGWKLQLRPGQFTSIVDVTSPKLFVERVPSHATVAEVREAFKQYGTVTDCMLVADAARGSGAHKGHGFVEFDTVASAAAAVSGKPTVLGKVLNVRCALPRKVSGGSAQAQEAPSSAGDTQSGASAGAPPPDAAVAVAAAPSLPSSSFPARPEEQLEMIQRLLRLFEEERSQTNTLKAQVDALQGQIKEIAHLVGRDKAEVVTPPPALVQQVAAEEAQKEAMQAAGVAAAVQEARGAAVPRRVLPVRPPAEDAALVTPAPPVSPPAFRYTGVVVATEEASAPVKAETRGGGRRDRADAARAGVPVHEGVRAASFKGLVLPGDVALWSTHMHLHRGGGAVSARPIGMLHVPGWLGATLGFYRPKTINPWTVATLRAVNVAIATAEDESLRGSELVLSDSCFWALEDPTVEGGGRGTDATTHRVAVYASVPRSAVHLAPQPAPVEPATPEEALRTIASWQDDVRSHGPAWTTAFSALSRHLSAIGPVHVMKGMGTMPREEYAQAGATRGAALEWVQRAKAGAGAAPVTVRFHALSPGDPMPALSRRSGGPASRVQHLLHAHMFNWASYKARHPTQVSSMPEVGGDHEGATRRARDAF